MGRDRNRPESDAEDGGGGQDDRWRESVGVGLRAAMSEVAAVVGDIADAAAAASKLSLPGQGALVAGACVVLAGVIVGGAMVESSAALAKAARDAANTIAGAIEAGSR